MFAKLKKKIETEGGSIATTASPRRSESVTSLQGIGTTPSLHGKDAASPPASVTSEDPSLRDVSSARDDLEAWLQKKSDQCRKLEGNVSDLAALIKEKNKTIEKLEHSLKQQDEVVAKKLQQQKDEFESYRDKLISGYQEDKLKLDQLLLTEEKLSKCEKDLLSRSQRCESAESQVDELTNELIPLRKQVASLQTESERLKEENSERAELITKLSKEKSVFDNRVDELNNEVIKKQSLCNSLQAKMAYWEESYKTLTRNSEMERNKATKNMREKDDEIEELKERVITLEQRVADSNLSGDDKVDAWETERKQLEMKLSESRQQLTEIKSSWSDKISHLEQQISHLNSKMAEDSEEMANQVLMTKQMKDGFEKQIASLRRQLEDAEKRALEDFESALSKDSHYEKQLMDAEMKWREELAQTEGARKEYKKQAELLQEELTSLKTSMVGLKNDYQSQIEQLTLKEMNQQDLLKQSEIKLTQSQTYLQQREQEVKELKNQLEERDSSKVNTDSMISSLHLKTNEIEVNLEKALKDKDQFEQHLRKSQNEKYELLEKNATLYQQLEVLKSSESECRQEHQRTLTLKADSDVNMKKVEANLRQKIEVLEQQIEQSELSKVESGLYSSRIEEMENSIVAMETQLTEKTRTIKKQDQMLKDLRLTLQRELKVQSLNTDDGNVGDTSNTSPLPSRRGGGRGAYTTDHLQNNRSDNISPSFLSSSSSSPSFLSSSQSSTSRIPPLHNNHHSNGQQYAPHSFNVNHTNNYSQSAPSPVSNSNPNLPTSPAVLPMDSSQPGNYHQFHALTSSSSSVPSGAGYDSLTTSTANFKRDLEKDVNFQYLKHVVLKFMLSREAEAIQLIKAVSMLLNFSVQEQELMRETLEWKMSWFGSKPPPGRGQTSKK